MQCICTSMDTAAAGQLPLEDHTNNNAYNDHSYAARQRKTQTAVYLAFTTNA